MVAMPAPSPASAIAVTNCTSVAESPAAAQATPANAQPNANDPGSPNRRMAGLTNRLPALMPTSRATGPAPRAVALQPNCACITTV